MKTVLFLGLEVPNNLSTLYNIIHVPFIRIIPKKAEDPEIQKAFANFDLTTHLIFTSKQAVEIFFLYAGVFNISPDRISAKCIGAIGNQTAARLQKFDAPAFFIADREMSEGLIEKLEQYDLTNAFLLWPHSSLSRPILIDWLLQRKIPHHAAVFYDTRPQIPSPLPNLDVCDEISFTSPSTVDAFIQAYGMLPKDKILSCIGPITKEYLTPCATFQCNLFSGTVRQKRDLTEKLHIALFRGS